MKQTDIHLESQLLFQNNGKSPVQSGNSGKWLLKNGIQ